MLAITNMANKVTPYWESVSSTGSITQQIETFPFNVIKIGSSNENNNRNTITKNFT